MSLDKIVTMAKVFCCTQYAELLLSPIPDQLSLGNLWGEILILYDSLSVKLYLHFQFLKKRLQITGELFLYVRHSMGGHFFCTTRFWFTKKVRAGDKYLQIIVKTVENFFY